MTNVFKGVRVPFRPYKLIRDAIGRRILQDPDQAERVRRCTTAFERRRYAALKVVEEAREVLFADMHEDDDEVAMEVGDLLEAVDKLLLERKISHERVEKARRAKARANGRFEENYLLAWTT